ncbi:MAG: FG-GAP repeat protein [Deltaproteobacteria bacterium]|nr:FG-GAP repeat protein [Deltaproteobacteria bacterium]
MFVRPRAARRGLIGPAGGSLRVDGVVLTVPAGALATETRLNVRRTDEAIPDGYSGRSALYRFEPDGTRFAVPVSVRMTVMGDAAGASVWWSREGGGYERLATTVSNGSAIALVTHFSGGFVATAVVVDAGTDGGVDAAPDVLPIDAAADVPAIDVPAIDVPAIDVPATGPLQAPRAIAPLSGSVVTSLRPTFRWALAAGTDGARVQVCGDRACASVERTLDATGDHAAPTDELAPGPHYWRLLGRLGGTTGVTPGPAWRFIVHRRGTSLSTVSGAIADFDGDGLADLAASAPYAASRTGRVNLYAGHAGGPTTTPLARLTGPDGIQRGFGSSLASADVNGDGLSDLLVGTLPGGGNVGRLHVFLNGGSGIAALPSVSLDPPSPLRISEFATALAAVGDMDGDGYPEVAAGAPIPALATSADASVVIYRGGADGLVATRTWRIYSTIRTIDFGAGLLSDGQVGSAGDVNGDGLADLAVGAPAMEDASTRGHVYVYLGRSTGPAAAPSTDLVGAGAWDVESFGRAAVGVGDVNGDGYGDLAVGAQGTAGQRVSIYPGSATGLVTTPMVTIPAPGSTGATTFFHGPCVTGAGDVNGDGYDDVAIGYASSTYGIATLHLGGPAGVAATPSTTLTGSTASYAFALAGPGDLDGDGYDDLVVAQPETVFVYRGSAAGLATVAATTLGGLDGPGSSFGTAVLGR